MYRFTISVHPQPADATPGDEMDLAGRRVRPLVVARDSLAATTLPCSFEEACARLGKLERMYVEPDGSFVWTSPQAEVNWQVDGNLFDRDGRLLFVDMKGTCPRDAFDRLLQALGQAQMKLMFQLTREAVFLDEAEFRRFAEASGA